MTRKHPKRVKPTCKWKGVFVTHSLDVVSYSSEVENLDVIYISSYLQMSQIPRITLNPLLRGKLKSRPVQQTNESWFSCRFESLLQRDDTIQNNPANSVILWHWNFFHHTDRPLRFANFNFEVKNTPWKSNINIKNDGLENGSPLCILNKSTYFMGWNGYSGWGW